MQQFISPPHHELGIVGMILENARREMLGNGEVQFTGKVLGGLLSYDNLAAVAVVWAPDKITI